MLYRLIVNKLPDDILNMYMTIRDFSFLILRTCSGKYILFLLYDTIFVIKWMLNRICDITEMTYYTKYNMYVVYIIMIL